MESSLFAHPRAADVFNRYYTNPGGSCMIFHGFVPKIETGSLKTGGQHHAVLPSRLSFRSHRLSQMPYVVFGRVLRRYPTDLAPEGPLHDVLRKCQVPSPINPCNLADYACLGAAYGHARAYILGIPHGLVSELDRRDDGGCLDSHRKMCDNNVQSECRPYSGIQWLHLPLQCQPQIICRLLLI